MKTALALAPALVRARMKSTKGMAWLEILGVASYALCAWMLFTVASGTWMFYRRAGHMPESARAATVNMGLSADQADVFGGIYLAMAILACAVLIVPVLGLGGAAARLGAQAKAESLAAMRLVGLTSGQTAVIRLVESQVAAVLGVIIGFVAWAVALPLWSLVSFQGAPIEATEMLMPWWFWVLGVSTVLVLAAVSTLLGLTKVWISPLGVSKRGKNKSLRAWRLVFFGLVALAFIGYLIFGGGMRATVVVGFAVAGIFVAGLMFATMVVAPWVLQLMVLPFTRASTPSTLLAARRITHDPKAAWRAIGGLSMLMIVATFASAAINTLMMADTSTKIDQNVPTMGDLFITDLMTGLLITLVFAMVIGVMVTLTQQASSVIEGADVARALDWAGAPAGLHVRTRLKQVALPLVAGLVGGIGIGWFLSLIVTTGVAYEQTAGYTHMDMNAWGVIGSVAVLAVVFALVAALACVPLERSLLGRHVRRND
ncbi:MAG: hypothetical protein Q4G30_10625 [Actinomycetaceae bacterium]|nr:hypothetical protein [Actinomycetaceae bacterium]